MEPLIWVALLIYIVSFILITRFSRNQVKYGSKDSSGLFQTKCSTLIKQNVPPLNFA